MSKKFIISICTVLLFSMLTSFSTVFAQDGPTPKNEVFSNDVVAEAAEDYTVETLVENEEYQKIKFTNNLTGEVEYLEADLSGEEAVYTATYFDEETQKEHEVQTYKEENEIVIQNLTTGEVERDELETDVENVVKDENAFSVMNLPGGNGEYVKQATINGKKTITDAMSGSVALIAGVVASVYGGIIAGIATTIAVHLMGLGAPVFYYKHEIYWWRDLPTWPATYVRYYEKSNHTGYINAAWKTSR